VSGIGNTLLDNFEKLPLLVASFLRLMGAKAALIDIEARATNSDFDDIINIVVILKI
jgi:hypothetical protein